MSHRNDSHTTAAVEILIYQMKVFFLSYSAEFTQLFLLLLTVVGLEIWNELLIIRNLG